MSQRGGGSNENPSRIATELLKHFSRKLKETTFVVIGAIRVKINDLPTSIELKILEICL